jgi:hypothetical protein
MICDSLVLLLKGIGLVTKRNITFKGYIGQKKSRQVNTTKTLGLYCTRMADWEAGRKIFHEIVLKHLFTS